MEGLGAQIVTLDEFAAMRDTFGKVVATSGDSTRSTPGTSAASSRARSTATSWSSSSTVTRSSAEKKGKPFQDVETRCLIVRGLRGVDYVVPFDAPGDPTVSEALAAIRPDVFTKGGDRVDATTIPEWEVCDAIGAEIVTGVGRSKEWSSSWFLDNWRKED